MEPQEHMTKVMLEANGYGKQIHWHMTEPMWDWNKEKIRSLDEEGLNQLIKHIVWN